MIQNLTSVHKIHNQINFGFVLECIMEAYNERVSYFSQYISFSSCVFDVVGFDKKVLAQSFQSEYFGRFLFADLIDL